MRASIVRRQRSQPESEDSADAGAIDALQQAVSNLHIRDLHIETALGRIIIKGIARYTLDREQLFEAAKQLDGWESNVVVDVDVEQHDVRGYHTVQKGETLASIAKRYFGRAAKDVTIFEANRDRMNDPSQIQPGQQLLIPWR